MAVLSFLIVIRCYLDVERITREWERHYNKKKLLLIILFKSATANLFTYVILFWTNKCNIQNIIVIFNSAIENTHTHNFLYIYIYNICKKINMYQCSAYTLIISSENDTYIQINRVKYMCVYICM